MKIYFKKISYHMNIVTINFIAYFWPPNAISFLIKAYFIRLSLSLKTNEAENKFPKLFLKY